MVGAFLYQLGLNEKAIEALTDAAPESMFYLNTKNIGELGITATRLEPQKTTIPPTRG